MAEPKTKKTGASVSKFLDGIRDERTRKDCKTIGRMMREATGAQAKMWGTSIVGYGSYHYRYASGREGDWFLTGFAPRAGSLTLYIMDGFQRRAPLMKKLGPHKTGKSCLYIKKLEDIDLDVLRRLIHLSVRDKARASR